MLVRIEKYQVIDISFHYKQEIENPWSMETTCVSKKYKEIDCYMRTSPFGISQMPEPCKRKENKLIFFFSSLIEISPGALLYDLDHESFNPNINHHSLNRNGVEIMNRKES